MARGTNVKDPKHVEPTVRDQLRSRVISANTDCTRALYTHSKILVAALNGPVMAFLGNFDFIYALPQTWLYVGFPFLGIAVEGGASVSFVNRMGLAKANEVLLFNKKKNAQELLECGFIKYDRISSTLTAYNVIFFDSKIFPSQSTESFHAAVREHLLSELDGLDHSSVLAIKALLRAGLSEKNNPDAVNLRESYAQAERFVTGVPMIRFGMIARKEIQHKL
ncbi:ClpP/crotonase-like domain-containing protein [Boletus reticuloceps]|uniref:ClpP/crotonase-like domain-containing protein n=1 Tax=Boletus reticuloceps TaxID=495285 RepID=A0A8I2YPX1_9AGAM|nr:ClpP/crotonase-like domain-containing protein [Boletus reticuloceps]